MRLSSILMALVGLGVAGGSAQLAREMIMAPQAEANAERAASMVQIVTAASEINRGDIIQHHMLRITPWPRDAVPTGAFLDREALLPASGQEPRRASRSMVPGEVILSGKVSDFGGRVTISQTLSPNSRAVAIRVDDVTSVGGFVTPGDYVDLLLTRTVRDELVTDTILRNIRVIGVDQMSDELRDDPRVARTVTVEVTAEQGQVLALSQRAGTLSLALRTADTDDTLPVERLRLSDLLPEMPKPVEMEPALEEVVAEAPAPPPAPRARTVILNRGTSERQEITLR
ncbi:pilus assembly protein CpaB [Roseinatronobacter thiooxidans]|uniref:Pilus assembly protein CpaB n=1 Tax=Roseinatronobacter thiooxidans TaxID=121821 RepID=A0A2W7PWD4_9RHOB|nr:Flp pilus assembly protein CpaB [Roseinatronobacter thiooxidans]PZX36217.1 pilus assembly protein CpaB [Roseinatronobacter thiooxidans]